MENILEFIIDKITGRIEFLIFISTLVFFIIRHKPPKKAIPIPVVTSKIHPSYLRELTKYDRAFHDIHFAETGLFVINDRSSRMIFKTFLSHDQKTEVMFSLVFNTEERIGYQFVEFCSVLTPHGKILTSNGQYPATFGYPQDQINTKLPKVKNIRQLYKYHQELLLSLAPIKYTAKLLHPFDLHERLRKYIDYENTLQVRLGRMKINKHGDFIFTIKGFCTGPVLLIIQFFHSLLWNLLVPSTEHKMKRAKEKIRKIPLTKKRLRISI